MIRNFGLVIISASIAVVLHFSFGANRVVSDGPGGKVVENDQIDESSGLAVSRLESTRFWTHNDSGDTPRLFRIDGPQHVVSEVQITGAQAVDWEDMASGIVAGRPTLVIGDVGDNGSRRASVMLYVLDEPDEVTENATLREQIELKYADGPMDCEALAIDGPNRRVLLIGKTRLPIAPIYAAELTEPSTTSATLPQTVAPRQSTAKRIGTLAIPGITAMDISADGKTMVVCGYFDYYLFKRNENETWESALQKTPSHHQLPRYTQIEAVCFDTSASLWITSEGSPMAFVKLDEPQEHAND